MTAVQPADEHAKRFIVLFREAECLVAAMLGSGGFSVVPEDFGEELGSGAEKFLMEDPVCVVGADVDIDH
jgi:hypothetical protein